MPHYLENLSAGEIVLESLPDEVLASMENRDRWMAGLQYKEGALEFLVADLQSWTPGQTVRVAFLGGSPDLWKAIEDATREILGGRPPPSGLQEGRRVSNVDDQRHGVRG